MKSWPKRKLRLKTNNRFQAINMIFIQSEFGKRSPWIFLGWRTILLPPIPRGKFLYVAWVMCWTCGLFPFPLCCPLFLTNLLLLGKKSHKVSRMETNASLTMILAQVLHILMQMRTTSTWSIMPGPIKMALYHFFVTLIHTCQLLALTWKSSRHTVLILLNIGNTFFG